MMNQIGVSYNNFCDINENDIIQILISLSDLHSNDIVHGDCRIQNVIKYQNNYLWIDLLGGVFSPPNIKNDIVMFLNSVERVPNTPKIEIYAKKIFKGLNITNKWSNEERIDYVKNNLI